MALFKTRSAAVYGIDAHLIDVEVDMYLSGSARDSRMVGMPDVAVRESRERIKSALINSGFGYPNKTLTINLAPANVRKEGAGFDLPVALGILGAMGAVKGLDHAVEFARRGFVVTGVDRSPFLLKRARERALASALEVEWVLDDMRHFERPASFHLACNLFTSFGYFEREEDNLRVLANLRQSLRDGGALVMDMVGKEHLERVGLGPRHTSFADGAVLIQQGHANADWTRLENDWTLIHAGHSRHFRFEHHLYSGQGLQHRLESCGFTDVRLYGDLAGSPYGS